MGVPVVLDVDTGVDDALALLLAAGHPGLDLGAVTCVAGNAPLPAVVRNTRVVLGACGCTDVPLAAGAGGPEGGPTTTVTRPRHGADGLAGLSARLPPDAPPVTDPREAVDVLRSAVLEAAAAGTPVTLVALGPLTNVAALARAHPAALGRVARLVAVAGTGLGGGARPSPTFGAPGADFNVGHDPLAATDALQACADLGVPVTLHGVDVLGLPRVPATTVQHLRSAAADAPGDASAGTPTDASASTPGAGRAARLAAGLLDFRARTDRDDPRTPPPSGSDAVPGAGPGAGASLGDAGAVAALLAPDAVATARTRVRVDRTAPGGGRVVPDPRGWPVDVVTGVDGPALVEAWHAGLTPGAVGAVGASRGRGPA
jgi:pyrimidine-specific ribonucleoside hydrolase